MNSDNEQRSIVCPECGARIDVNELLYHQVEEELRKTFNNKLAKERRKLEEKSTALTEDRKALDEQRRALQDDIQAGVTKQLEAERQKLETQIRKSVTEETSEQYKSMQEELERKSKQVKELNKAKADIARLTREKDELKETIEAEVQQRLNETLKEEKSRIQERAQLKLSEKDSVIKQLKDQLNRPGFSGGCVT